MNSFTRFLKKNIHVRSKIWIETDGLPLMGTGRAALLKSVEKSGSIYAAAKLLRMDYRRAWGLIDSMEKRLDVKLVIRRRGGKERGTSLTVEAKELLALYHKLERRSQAAADRQFHSIFREGKGKS
jgi:molybdate transport repressor ModE-like protein